MTLAPGTRLGPHEILSPWALVGLSKCTWGGHAARADVLPSHMSASQEVRQRFEREKTRLVAAGK
jgi:hypothetical protein